MTAASDVVCILGVEDHMQKNAKNKMDQIRNTMMQHEALFQEQVQTLHKLYNIQKSSMQEIRKQIYFQVQHRDAQVHSSVPEGSQVKPVHAIFPSDEEESHSLSLPPFSSLNELVNSGSLWAKAFHISQSKQVRNFDLERLPEEYMGESEETGANSIHFNSDYAAGGASYLGFNTSISEVDSPSSKEISQDFVRVSNGYVGLNPSNQNQTDTLMLLHQDSKVSLTQRSTSLVCGQIPFEGIANQTTKYVVPVSAKSNENLASKVTNISGFIGGISVFHKNLAICTEGSSTKESMNCPQKYPNDFVSESSISLERISLSVNQNSDSLDFTSQTKIDGGNEFRSDSGNGSNSDQYQDTKTCKHQNLSIVTKESKPDFTQGGLKPFLSSSFPDCENVNNTGCSNGFNETKITSEDPVVCIDSNGKLSLEQENESIAAEILLSFAPNKTQDSTQIEVGLGKSSKDNGSSHMRWNLRERRCNGSINDSVRWTKSFRRRRSSRRPR